MRTHARQAFTLIELLVVIAIIAILAGILFPVFAKAREKAEQTECTSNVKQISMSFQMYASDFDQKFPPIGAWDNGTNIYRWPFTVMSYVKNTQLFQCRAFPDDQNYDGGPMPGCNSTGVSYGMNERITHSASHATLPGVSSKQTRVTKPAETVLIYDASSGASPWTALADDGSNEAGVADAMRANHGGDDVAGKDTGFSIVGYVDGHAKAVRADDLLKSGNQNLWNPRRP